MIFLDSETRSACNLKKHGAYIYANDPTTDAMCWAWALNQGPVHLWHPGFEDRTFQQGGGKRRHRADLRAQPAPEKLFRLIEAGEQLEAWNVQFDKWIWKFVMVRLYGWPEVPDDQWTCAAAKARANGLPGKLEDAANAWGTQTRKDIAGGKVMKGLSKPRPASAREPEFPWHQQRADLIKLFRYCIRDVRAQREITTAEGMRPLSGDELAAWRLHETINERGMPVDRELVKVAVGMADRSRAAASSQLLEMTDHMVSGPTDRAGLKAWLKEKGLPVPIKVKKNKEGELEEKETTESAGIVKLLAAPELDDELKAPLAVWVASTKASVAKYEALDRWSALDGRARGMYQFHGAHTGRASGSGPQPQNLASPEEALGCASVLADLVAHGDYDLMEVIFGEGTVPRLLSSAQRGAISAAPGFKLVSADYNAVEARGIAWLAGDQEYLAMFRRLDADKTGTWDTYTWTASQMYRREVTKKDKTLRKQGKVAALACQYQGAVGALRRFCDKEGIVATDEQLAEIVQLFRESRRPIVYFWYALENAFVEAVANPGKIVFVRNLALKCNGRFLNVRLPSGRLLRYLDPKIEVVQKFGRPKPTMTYWGINTFTRKYGRQQMYGGKAAENITQAVCYDLLAHGLAVVEAAGYPVVMHTHDEPVSEVPEGFGSGEEYARLLMHLPKWAVGFPHNVSGIWEGRRYRK